VLLSTDAFFRKIITGKEFQRPMSSAEFHNLAGKYIREREKALGIGQKSLLSAAYSAAVPIYTSSPGDSSIGMNIAAVALDGNKLLLDPNRDVNETASIVLDAKRGGGKSGVMILGGGSPKNFMLQTEPQIQEVLGIDEKGHDYFLQITDARPDAVVCYLDSTVALPLLTSYAFARHQPRSLKRLFDRREAMMSKLQHEYRKSSSQPPAIDHTDSKLPQHR
jgi:deoxyhypusine synthase